VSETTSRKPKKLLDQLRDAIRIKHYSYSTEKTYVHWAKRYILFHNKRQPAEMGVPVRPPPRISTNTLDLLRKIHSEVAVTDMEIGFRKSGEVGF
jgi:hypothetical protein